MTPVRPVQPAKSSMVSEGLANHDRSACRDALFSQGPGQPPGMAEQGRAAYRDLVIPFAALLVAAVLIILQIFSWWTPLCWSVPCTVGRHRSS